MNNNTHLLPNLPPRIPGTTTRRQALKGLGLGALGLAATKLLSPHDGSADAALVVSMPMNASDVNLLNFALNLEYLEAQYYTVATTGTNIQSQGIPGNGTGKQGPVVIPANAKVPFVTSAIEQFATQIAADEQAHVLFLRSLLGNKAVAQPKIDLDTSFTNMALQAGFITSGSTFNPFNDELSFILGAYFFEDVMATAYRGIIRSTSNATIISDTSGLLGTESYHAGNIRTVVYDYNTTAQNISGDISNLRESLDGTGNDDAGVVVDGTSNIILTNTNGLVFSRTMRQVLDIFYLGQNAAKGGFFPNGIN